MESYSLICTAEHCPHYNGKGRQHCAHIHKCEHKNELLRRKLREFFNSQWFEELLWLSCDMSPDYIRNNIGVSPLLTESASGDNGG